MDSVSAFVLDEVHECNRDLLLLLLLLRERFRPRMTPGPPQAIGQKLVLMSATADSDQWRQYFGTVSPTGIIPLPDDAFHEVMVPAGAPAYQRNRLFLPRPLPNIFPAVASRVLWAVQERTGNILVFVSGADEMRGCKDEIELYLRSLPSVLWRPRVFELSATTSERDTAQALAYPSRKIILATNVAESGITVPGVSVVIDTGLYKQVWLNAHILTDSLERCTVPQSSAEQRAGRTGRTCDGEVFHMFTKEDHDAAPRQAPSAIETEDVIEVLVRLALRFGSIWACQHLLQQPTPEQIDVAATRLRVLNVIDDAGQLPYHPHVDPALIFGLGLDFRLACMLLGAIHYRCLKVMIKLVAMLSRESRSELHVS